LEATLPGVDAPRRPPGTLQEYVAVAINDAILAGRLRPGQRIAPEVLARELGVSHIPVREALQSLVGQGQVIRRSYRGFYVPPMSVADFSDAHLWRQVLEEKAYEMACEKITDEDLAQLTVLYERMAAAMEEGDSVLHARLNRDFHLLPVRRVGSERLERFLTYLWNVCDLYFATMIRAGGDVPRLQEQHVELIAAFAARDAPRVNEIMRRHRQFSFGMIRPAIEPGEEPT
jgi:DNA-binding GntR family transcriptional regulator